MKSALYYPTIEFQDIDFLKKSILLWDRVFRIVPATYCPQDVEEVRDAISVGAISNIIVDDSEKNRAANKFLEFYQVRKDYRTRLSWPAGFSSNSFAKINPEKIDARLVPLFEQLATHYDGDFLSVPEDIVGGYMFYLAHAVAEQRELKMLTDTPESWTVGTFFAQKGNFNDEEYESEVNAYLCNLAIDDVLPDTLEAVSMDEVLLFVEKHSEERQIFQDELEALRFEISKCNNKAHAEYVAHDFVKKFERAKNEYKKAVGFFSKREFCSIFSSGIAATMGVLALPTLGAIGDPYSPVRMASGLLIGAVAALATREMIPVNKGVGSYLVSAENLGSSPSWRLHREFHEFIND